MVLWTAARKGAPTGEDLSECEHNKKSLGFCRYAGPRNLSRRLRDGVFVMPPVHRTGQTRRPWELFGPCKANVRRTFGKHRPDTNLTATERQPNTHRTLWPSCTASPCCTGTQMG